MGLLVVVLFVGILEVVCVAELFEFDGVVPELVCQSPLPSDREVSVLINEVDLTLRRGDTVRSISVRFVSVVIVDGPNRTCGCCVDRFFRPVMNESASSLLILADRRSS